MKGRRRPKKKDEKGEKSKPPGFIAQSGFREDMQDDDIKRKPPLPNPNEKNTVSLVSHFFNKNCFRVKIKKVEILNLGRKMKKKARRIEERKREGKMGFL